MTDDDDECPGCGSSFLDRERRAAQYPDDKLPTGLSTCPHCGSQKCSMCDMGDDVECISCPH